MSNQTLKPQIRASRKQRHDVKMPRISLSDLYLSSLGAIFTVAFISYYVQYPALSSQSARIEPCQRIFRQAFPRLYENAIDSGYFDVDSFVELINLVGIVLSTIIARYVALLRCRWILQR